MQITRSGAPSTRDGNQTLARGLGTLLAIADSQAGMTVREVEEMLGVHRSIAYRLLQTLGDFGLVARGRKGVYLPGARLATLAQSYLPWLRDLAMPLMRSLSDQLRSTIAIFVEQGTEALAVSMVEPTTSRHHIAFRAGMSTPMNVGAAAHAILAGGPVVENEAPAVGLARELGFARSEGEVESGEFAVAASIPMAEGMPRASLTLITHRADIAAAVGPEIRRSADELGELIAQQGQKRA